MRFGRVEGVVTPVEADGARLLRLIVWLDSPQSFSWKLALRST